MKKFSIIMSMLLVFVLGFSTVAFAASSSTNTTLSKNIINEANKGDAKAQKIIDNYFVDLFDAAKNGDSAAIQKLQNLDCFSIEKNNAILPVNGLKVNPGETNKHYFDDGSAVSLSDNSLQATGEVTISSYNLQKTKTWWFGPVSGSLTTMVDTSGSSRYIAHIASLYTGCSSFGCSIGDINDAIITQDGNPSTVQSSGIVTLPFGAGTRSVLVQYHVDTVGLMTQIYSNPL